MIVDCMGCGRIYDDSECWTVCPHGPLWASVASYCQRCDLVDCPTHKTGRYTERGECKDARPVFGKIGNYLADIGAGLRTRWGKAYWRARVRLGLTQKAPSSGAALYPFGRFDADSWADAFCLETGFPESNWARCWFANALMTGYDHGTEDKSRSHAMVQLWNISTGEAKMVTPSDEFTPINQTTRVTLAGGTYEVEFKAFGEQERSVAALERALKEYRDKRSDTATK